MIGNYDQENEIFYDILKVHGEMCQCGDTCDMVKDSTNDSLKNFCRSLVV